MADDWREFWGTESRVIRKEHYPVKVVFTHKIKDSVRRIVHFKNNTPYLCEGKNCKLCQDGVRVSKVFYAEVYDIEEGQPKILTGSKKLALALIDWEEEIEREEGDEDGLKGKAFKISRLGSDRNPDWQLKPLPYNKKVKPQLDLEAEVNQMIRRYEEEESLESDLTEVEEEYEV